MVNEKMVDTAHPTHFQPETLEALCRKQQPQFPPSPGFAWGRSLRGSSLLRRVRAVDQSLQKSRSQAEHEYERTRNKGWWALPTLRTDLTPHT